MSEEAGQRLRSAFEREPLNASSQRSIDAARQHYGREERADIAVLQDRRQMLASQHHNIVDPDTDQNGHPGSLKQAGCPYCYPPGRLGDYAPQSPLRPLWTPESAIAAADAYRDAADDEAPS